MTKARRTGLLLILLGAGLFVFTGEAFQRSTSLGLMDFKVLYHGARCFIHHCDPYNVAELQEFYKTDGGEQPSDPPIIRYVVTEYVYLPTTFLITGPFATLPWSVAHVLWTILTVACFITAAFLTWDLCARYAPVLAGALIGFWLASSVVIFAGGNAVGLVISLCVIALWCFVQERFPWGGVLCLAISLVLKPHDAGLVWLYFLLAGGAYRKRALQTLATTAVLGFAALLWVSQVSPHWRQEQRANLAAISTRGGMDDPGPGSTVDRTPGLVIDLQSVVSIFRNSPRIYNSVSYVICGSLILLWAVHTVRSQRSLRSTWLALAAIAPLTMLVTYHKPYDAKLLLLTIPACILLWIENGQIGKIAVFVNTIAIVFTSDIPLGILVFLTRNFHSDTGSLHGMILTVVLTRPVTLILLVVAIFYLWVYIRRTMPNTRPSAVPNDSSE
ncbi:MAG: glycosyltransferase family 87 protein [Terracidiphilus sp.]